MSAPKLALVLAVASLIEVAAVEITGSSTGAFAEPSSPLFPSESDTQFRDLLGSPTDDDDNPYTTGPEFLWGSITDPDTNEPIIDQPYSSSFFFDGADLSPFETQTSGSVGSFTYYNGTSEAGTGVEFVDFKLSLVVDGSPEIFTFPLQIRNLYNTSLGEAEEGDAPEGSDWADADIVRFVIRSIALNDDGDYLNLSFEPELGVDPDGQGAEDHPEGFNAFQVRENRQWTATIHASIGGPLAPVDDPLNSVPDSGATIALLGVAFVSLGAFASGSTETCK